MKRFWLALTVALFFYAKMDILIWQRIFETHELIDLGVGVYHWGWVQALFGFMILGVLLFYPDVRRMVTFPLSLGLLAFSGLEDILYYVLDGKPIPDALPWLADNPMIYHSSRTGLISSVIFWLILLAFLHFVLYEWKNRRLGLGFIKRMSVGKSRDANSPDTAHLQQTSSQDPQMN